MRLRAAEPEEIKMNMTSMIDIVFQLLVFFVMTFNPVSYEGDFSVKMPLNSDTPSETIDLPKVISVNLASDPGGKLTNITVDSVPVDQNDLYGGLTKAIEARLAGEGNPDSTTETEVDFDIAPALKYSYTVAAIEAVSGKKEGDVVTRLISRIKFQDNSEK
ncbi:biopolymer transporter ExbD [Mariniblastus sp.]|nr:biopolymer transporter ExbD [Mariniblastus sp.]